LPRLCPTRTTAAALQNGEIDWWEQFLPDVAPVLRKDRDVVVDIIDPLGVVGWLAMNHLYPPFDERAGPPRDP